jgi:DNA-binding winged helix-turn-helix (wHTH) protein/TolB-like protein/Tfp pilus assembly protein PilF
VEECWQNDGKMLVTVGGYDTSGEAHYEFGPFRLYPSEQLLLRQDDPIPLAPKAFDLLVALIGSHGHLVTRETLMQTLWPNSFVEETNLTVNISLLRKALEDMPSGRPWIATVPKRGYRFDGPVTIHPAGNGASALMENPPVREDVAMAAEVVEASPAETEAPQSLLTTPEGSLRRRWLLSVASILAVVACVWIGFSINQARHVGEETSLHTIAVLPFQSTGVNAGDQYLGIGMTDALITRLGRLSQIVVRPIGAVRSIGKTTDPLAAGRQLNVQAVLNGTVQRVGNRTEVVVHLQRVSDGNVLWSESFDEENSSDFEIEDSISQRLAKALALRLSHDEKRQLATPSTPNGQAYELYTQGRYYWNKRSMESVQKSIDLFLQATKLDPNYAEAWSGLADSWILAGSYGNSFLEPSVAMPKAKEAAEKALALDDSSAEAHTSLAYIHLMWDWDFASAEQEFKRALQINPAYVNAHHWYSHELVALGRITESHEQSEAALALDPTDVVINEHMAWHHMMAREYDRSIPQAKKAVELDPSFVQAHRVLGLGLLYTGRSREACTEFEKGVELSHGDPVASAYLARCYALTQREPEARKILLGLEEASTERYISAAEIAAVYAALNDSASAIKWLDKACDERAGTLIYLNADRVWDPLRTNPKFAAELKRVNLPVLADEVLQH